MSPSERAGRALGIAMVALGHRRDMVLPANADPKTKVAISFATTIGGRRHRLTAWAKSRAGAWQAAVRWVKRLERGEL